MNCIFVSDLHGQTNRYASLFRVIREELPDAVFIGGDLLPTHHSSVYDIDEFIEQEILGQIRTILQSVDKPILFFLIMGNDDPRIYEKSFLEADEEGILHYVNEKTIKFHNLYVSGYSYVPPTPFLLKDWERFDVSQYVDVGAISPEGGKRTVDVSQDDIRHRTIEEDLKELSNHAPPEQTIFLFHSPPYKSYLDRAKLDGKLVDHAPLDVHVGSIAIKRFIETKQPFLTLHGHVHESTRLTGKWQQKFGNSYAFNAAHDGPELCLVRFNTDYLKKATREIIPPA